MSATEIINELPKLTEAERRAVGKKLLELAATRTNITTRGKHRNRRVDPMQPKSRPSRSPKFPDFLARAKKIFPRQIPKSVVDMADRLIAGE